jgi:hypothetical protein
MKGSLAMPLVFHDREGRRAVFRRIAERRAPLSE